MITRTTTFAGLLFIVSGLLGFISPDFLGMRLNTAHNLVFIVSGFALIYFGLLTSQRSGRAFCIVLGAFYGLLGLTGFVMGGLAGTMAIIPGTLILGVTDHVIHLILGTAFLAIGLASTASQPVPAISRF